ncbi:hypothetical protein DXG03_003770 [Asterophora parasitica]|uniref:Uncharacterized protein n=1 Tax=Asterophora parasitica TaxID=117018 RepID=A0A9P7G1R7_9AGAR|nr:hypothetical protein DXG03_003770 [Asterophora parasitica]
MPSKNFKGSTASTSSAEIGPASSSKSHPNHGPTSQREPLRSIGQVQAPIGSERHRWTAPPGGSAWSFTPDVNQVPPECQKPPVHAPTTFIDTLIKNKRRNPHAPSMVSMFNPLREQIPFRAWACIPLSPREARGSDTLALPSARFRTSVYAIPDRRRRECEWATSALWRGKAYWLNKTRHHCWDCKHEPLRVKVLAFHYHTLRSRYPHRLSPLPFEDELDDDEDDEDLDDPMEVEIDDTASSGNSLLDSPIIRDRDDFDDFDEFGDGPNDNALLRNQEDVEMGDISLF